MRDILTGYVERGEVPGVAALVSRRGEVHVEALGHQAIAGAPMRRDTIFRIHSLSKPIAAAAAMILLEECRIRLDDPVERWLPELADRRVLTRLDGPIDDTVPAERPITVRDVLTFRLGYGQLMASPESHPILQAMADLDIGDGSPGSTETPPPDEWLRRLATLPLMHQPGERWTYNTGSDVLGVLIARVAGQPLDTLLRERVFAPLGMIDTGFSVPPEKLDRLTTAYSTDPETHALTLDDLPAAGAWSRPPAFPSAAGGLVSTLDDYHAFARMLLNNGTHEGRRLLSRPSVALMTRDHLTTEQRATAGFILGEKRGWGFGVTIVTEQDQIWSPLGRYGWYGGAECAWFSDPGEDLITILLAQNATEGASWPGIWADFWTTAYAALED